MPALKMYRPPLLYPCPASGFLLESYPNVYVTVDDFSRWKSAAVDVTSRRVASRRARARPLPVSVIQFARRALPLAARFTSFSGPELQIGPENVGVENYDAFLLLFLSLPPARVFFLPGPINGCVRV